jgi:hypothetical protein
MYLGVHGQEFKAIVRQCGLEDEANLRYHPILWLCVWIVDLSILTPISGVLADEKAGKGGLAQEDDQGGVAPTGNPSPLPVDVDPPIQNKYREAFLNEGKDSSQQPLSMRDIFAAFKPFHKTIGTLVFGLTAFFIGTITTFLYADWV